MSMRLTPTPLLLDGLAKQATTLPKLSKLAVRVAHLVMLWDRRARTRRALSWLDDDRLRDVGLDAAAAAREADKPFWRP